MACAYGDGRRGNGMALAAAARYQRARSRISINAQRSIRSMTSNRLASSHSSRNNRA